MAGLAALFQGTLPPRAAEHVPGSASALAAIEEDTPHLQPGHHLYGAFEHEAYDAAEEEEPVELLVPGEGQRKVLDADNNICEKYHMCDVGAVLQDSPRDVIGQAEA